LNQQLKLHMKNFLLFAGFLAYSSLTFAQQGDGGTPMGFKFGPDIRDIDGYIHPQPDIQALLAEDAENDKNGTTFWRFGYHHTTNYTFENSGTWTTLPNGGKIWQLLVKSEGARTINLIFKDTQIPEGCELYIYNPEKNFVLGKFLQYHLVEGQLGTELVPGNTVIIEYYVPKSRLTNYGTLNLHKVSHGYRTVGDFAEKAFGGSGSCNMNVNCPDGTPWANQKRGAVMLVSGGTNGSGFCSGSLINNTANNGKPYILTANHCGSSGFANWVFRFNWQATGCTNPGSSPTFQSLSGSISRASRQPSDFRLVEISGGLQGGTVPASFNPYFPGWNNANTPPTSTVCIHHPSGDIKKISFDDAAATAVQAMGSTEANSSWQVEWDRNTTTEGGSSGSPLFDQNGRIIGQLWGGSALCSNLSAPDYYGRVFNSWAPAGSANSAQLKFWLDPGNSGVTFIDGYDPLAVSYSFDAQVAAVITPTPSTTCNTDFTPQITIKNNGTSTLDTLAIKYRVNGGAETVFNWSGTLATGASANVNLAPFTVSGGNHTFKVYTSQPNGNADQNNGNDTLNVSFTTLSATGVSLPVSQGFENTTFPPTGWALENPDNTATWARTTAAAAQGSASARKDNLNSNDAGQVDNLLSPFMNFTGYSTATLTFKVAYARYSAAYFDSLIVWATIDCGQTWSRVYNKGNTTLATNGGANLTTQFIPTANQWRTETVNLTPFVGQSNVRLRFQNKSGYGNFIYLDDINITGTTGSNPPSASFSASASSVCAGQSVTFTNSSTGAATYSWTIQGGTPSSSSDANPTAVFNTPGNYTITLTATNGNGSNTATQSITVNPLPATPTVGSNSPVTNNGTLSLSAGNSTGNYVWTGPNGFSSNQQNPSVNNPGTYGNGQYCCYAVAAGCTSQTACTTVIVSGFTSLESQEVFAVAVFPNPTQNMLYIHAGNAGPLVAKMTDMTGKIVFAQRNFQEAQFSLDLSDLAKGVYILSLENEKGQVLRKVIKQ
jgi:lysyl endopeptidase